MRGILHQLVVVIVFVAVPGVVTVTQSTCLGGETFLDPTLQTINTNKSNLSIRLRTGEYCIHEFDHILEGLYNVSIEGEGNVTIRCMPGRGLAVFNATGLTISNVVFNQCGITNEKIFDFLTLVNETIDFFFTISNNSANNISILCGHCEDFQLNNVTVKNTLGLGFLGINLIGESVFNNVTFSHNVPSGCYFLSSDILETERIGGGALLIYADYQDDNALNLTKTYSLRVSDSNFLYNSYCSKLYLTQFYTDYINNNEVDVLNVLNGGGGLGLKLAQVGYKVNLTVTDTVFMNNTARGGGGANVQVYAGVYNSSIEFIDCSFLKNGLKEGMPLEEEYENYTTYGSGLLIATDSYNPQVNRAPCLIERNIVPTLITISGTQFTDNRAISAAALSIISLYSPGQRRQFPHIVKLASCKFKQNSALSGSAMMIQEWKYIAAQSGLNVILEDVIVTENKNYKVQQISSEIIPTGVIHIIATNVTISGQSLIENNVGSGVYMERGILHVDGNLTVFNNSASLGAGIRVETQSLIIVNNRSKLNLIDNRASVYGGAIFSNIAPETGQLRAHDCPIYFGELNLLCFQDFVAKCANLTDFDVDVFFSGNSAQLGSVVYGATLDDCPWAKQLMTSNETENVFELLYAMDQAGLRTPMHFGSPPNTSKELATSPIALTISDTSNESRAVVPGHSITVHTAAYDEFNQSSVTVITSLVNEQGQINKGKAPLVGSNNYWLLGPNETTHNVPLTVYGDQNSEDFNITFVTVGSYAQDTIQVHLTGCPPGYNFENITSYTGTMLGSCVCDDRFKDIPPAPVSCIDINDSPSLSVPADVWVGFERGENSSLVLTTCHFDYCLENDKNVSNGNFSLQCNDGFNRDGVGCGGCKEGYGLVLGSNRCDQCSNWNILFIIVFAVVGVILIFVLSLFHVTVANGYLNGLLFFSTVITLFNPVLSAQSRTIASLLQIFSWLNLDLDLERCFYANMTAPQRMALRFVFPVYLYLLMIIIILVAKVSQRFANIFNRRGYSATKLFATLFVMTYTNILTTCIEILGGDYVTDLDKNLYYVWRVDSNQRYFQGEHVPLCILAIIILIVYLIPAPFVLLFPGIGLRIPLLKKYKPLYDAFWAPFKPNFRFWIGLRLLLRFIPLVLTNFIQAPASVLCLAVFLLLLAYVQAIFQPFEGKGRNASDLFLLLNLVGLVSGYLYFYVYQFNSRDLRDTAIASQLQWQIAYFSVGIGLVYFQLLVLLIVKTFVRFPVLQFWGWKLLTKVCRCKVFAKWIPKKPNLKTSHKSARKRKSYGATSEDDDVTDNTSTSVEFSGESEEPPAKRTPATYSELREPLMDTCGLAEIEPRYSTN